MSRVDRILRCVFSAAFGLGTAMWLSATPDFPQSPATRLAAVGIGLAVSALSLAGFGWALKRGAR